ncbi:MAG: hypothetical protein QOC84_163 [Bradyrhizobium sp.]|jgi:hypothetical protein|nr:hypothetical protein [Bradyrhizobium sp.]
MSQKYCYQIGEWVDDNVSQQVEKCVEQDCNWWCACCNKWLCGLVWIVVTLAKWVVQTVCEIIGDAVDLVVALLTGGWDIVAGIFTWDWSRVWDGFMEIVGAFGGLLGDLIRAFTLCGLVGGFRESINKWRLRGYVDGLIDTHERFTARDRAEIKKALGISGSDGFGLRLITQSYRGYVRSDYIASGETVPALVRWNNDPNPDTKVDLKTLAGFRWNKFFERGRPDVRGDHGDISESDIDAYLADPTSRSFSIYAMSDAVQLEKIHAVQIKGDTIGLKLEVDLNDVQFTEPTQVRAIATSAGVVNNLAAPPFNRPPLNSPDAVNVLCSPVIVGTYLFRDNSYSGYSAHLNTCTCLDGSPFVADRGTGAEYRDRLPGFTSTYVPIHELGHTFGLCHVDGLDRIMVSPRDHSWWSWWLLPEYVCFSGEPQFVYDEAKKVWDYIIANFPTDCLARRHFG